MAGRIEVQLTSIARARRRVGGDDTWLQLRTKSGVLADFAGAVEHANQAAAARGDGDEAFALPPGVTPRGFAVQLVRATTLEAVNRWVADLAQFLEVLGFSGKLGGAVEASVTPCLASGLPPTPTAFVAWVQDLPRMRDDPAGWCVAPDATARITELADRWARRPDAELVLDLNAFPMVVALDDAAPVLARSVSESGRAGLDFRNNAENTANHVYLSYEGDGVFQAIDEQTSWEVRLDRLIDAITSLPADTNHAYIRPGVRNETGHGQIDVVVPLPGIRESDVRYNKHLLDRYLPDAHGVQVVRTAHLDNAHDLTGWVITDLGSGRHLLQAPDLTPWYAQTLPDPDTLTRARADFTGALLTPQIIADNPSPWPSANA